MIDIQKHYETLTDIAGSMGIGNSGLFKEFTRNDYFQTFGKHLIYF